MNHLLYKLNNHYEKEKSFAFIEILNMGDDVLC